MTTYPGNSALAPDVQKRVVETFRHAVESAADGNSQEALLGCDFVLRLDESFEPARKLQQMIAQQRPPETLRGLLAGIGAPPAATPVASFTAAAPGLVATFHRLFEARRFEELLAAAQSQTAAVAGDPKLRDLVAQAQARYEAEPFVREQLDLARRALGSGDLGAVTSAVARAREIDASHPGLAEIERLRASASSMSNSLKIDWDEEDHAMPPPVDLGEPAPAAPPPETPAPAEPDFPDIDFAREGAFFDVPASPTAATEDPATRPGTAAASDEASAFAGLDDLALPEFDAPAPSFEAADAPPTLELGGSAGEGDGRVRALLDEGETAFGNGDYQSAIDAWSRIFLIDIDNEEAAKRIERARQLKAEQERAVEEIFHEGVARFDAGDWDAAGEAFRRVLATQPSYVLAREYLDKLDERAAMGAAPGGLPEMAPLPVATPAGQRSEAETAVRRRPGGEEILVPPEPGDARESRRPALEGFAVKKKKGVRMTPAFLGIGGAVLVALGVGGWLLASNWNRLFPNAPAPAATAPSDTASVVARARKLHEEGKTAVAIAQLRRIPPQDASYAEAQSLVSQWEKLVEAPADAGLPPELARRQADLVRQAGAALAGGETFVARRLLAEAATIAPLDAAGVELSVTVEQRAAAFAAELALVRDGDHERALGLLWRRHEADPADKDVRRLMVDAYYNLVVADLQRGDPRAARGKLREARELDRGDPMLDRLDQFCAVYEKREQDLLYRIFVKYLPAR
jgi:tetratricopeptide (TPR) repeat protein